MKTELGVSLAVLAALAAHGRDFDRATLNAMLEKLAASPEPKVTRGPMAMCYKMALPVPVEVRYVCPKCGTVTRFMSARMKNNLAFLRDGAATLKGMGLDIALDESSLCRACSPGPKMPRAARMAKSTEAFAEGDEVVVLDLVGRLARIAPRQKGLWVSAQYVDRANACITADSVRIRQQPGENGKVVAFLNRGHKVKLLSAEKDDPAGWVRLEHAAYGLEERGVLMQLGDLKDLSYGDGDFALEERFDNVSWVINGRRTRAWMSDVNLLRTFLSGRLVLKEARDKQVPLKRRIDRLRELLGDAKK